eukprot:TRINITY_DN11055_c0_g1_i1.p1 TRINITY_DN11055_c0_g1~~TRINITY_DN11055_c0_g1_i1.p1  ORF type:complete len:433 (+),score=62.71 TRINITY_DN11055_c0_g1_i1:49-1347(+)
MSMTPSPMRQPREREEKHISPSRGYFNVPPYLPPAQSPPGRDSRSPHDPSVMYGPPLSSPPTARYPPVVPGALLPARGGSWRPHDEASPQRSPLIPGPATSPYPRSGSGGRPVSHSLLGNEEPAHEPLRLVLRLARPTEPIGVHCHEGQGKVIVKDVAPDAPALRAGVKAGDIVVRVEEFEVREQADMRRGRLVALDKGKTEVVMDVLRPKGAAATFPAFPAAATSEARIAQQLGALQAAYDSGALTRVNFQAEVVRVKGYVPEAWRGDFGDPSDSAYSPASGASPAPLGCPESVDLRTEDDDYDDEGEPGGVPRFRRGVSGQSIPGHGDGAGSGGGGGDEPEPVAPSEPVVPAVPDPEPTAEPEAAPESEPAPEAEAEPVPPAPEAPADPSPGDEPPADGEGGAADPPADDAADPPADDAAEAEEPEEMDM